MGGVDWCVVGVSWRENVFSDGAPLFVVACVVQELADDNEYEDIVSDVREEVSKYGQVRTCSWVWLCMCRGHAGGQRALFFHGNTWLT